MFSQLIEFFPLCLTKFDFFFFKISAVFCDKEAAFKIELNLIFKAEIFYYKKIFSLDLTSLQLRKNAKIRVVSNSKVTKSLFLLTALRVSFAIYK